MQRTVAIVHTTPATIAAVRGILSRMMPELTVHNYLDDSLLPEINRDGFISDSVRYRFFSLAQGAALSRPDAMLCACSSMGELVEMAAPSFAMPFLRIDAPMAREVALRGGRAVVLATLGSTLRPTRALIEREAARLGSDLALTSMVIEGAGALLTSGDTEGYDALLCEHFLRLADQADTLVLAQASMARALSGLPDGIRAKFVTSPESGLGALVDVVKSLEGANP